MAKIMNCGGQGEVDPNNGHCEEDTALNKYLLVFGYPHHVTKRDLYALLSTYGEIQELKFTRQRSQVQYIPRAMPQAYESLVNSPVYFDGAQLHVEESNEKSTKRDPTGSTPPKSPASPHTLVKKLQNSPNFDAQIQTLVLELQLPSTEQHKLDLICRDLEMVLDRTFPGCRAIPFGSTVTGLAFKDCDLDVYIQIQDPPVLQMNDDESLRFVKKSKAPLYRRPDLFSSIVHFTKSRTHIIKCLHVPTGTSCDFNFKNELGRCNSELVKYLISTDSRLRPLIFIIKYWALNHRLSGTDKLSNYALVMLFIFYLQQLSLPLLPPVAKLLSPQYEYAIEGWHGGSNFHVQYFPQTCNTDSIPKLLHGFFKFCLSFDFTSNVVSPFTGTTITKADFENVDKLPDEYYRYKHLISTPSKPMSPLQVEFYLCIQDPFEHNCNLTMGVNLKVMEHFQNCCAFGAQICEDILSKDVNVCKKMLPRLFTEKPPVVCPTSKHRSRDRTKAKSGRHHGRPKRNISNPNGGVPESESNNVYDELLLQRDWREQFLPYLFLMLLMIQYYLYSND